MSTQLTPDAAAIEAMKRVYRGEFCVLDEAVMHQRCVKFGLAAYAADAGLAALAAEHARLREFLRRMQQEKRDLRELLDMRDIERAAYKQDARIERMSITERAERDALTAQLVTLREALNKLEALRVAAIEFHAAKHAVVDELGAAHRSGKLAYRYQMPSWGRSETAERILREEIAAVAATAPGARTERMDLHDELDQRFPTVDAFKAFVRQKHTDHSKPCPLCGAYQMAEDEAAPAPKDANIVLTSERHPEEWEQPPTEIHDARITDRCYGITGGVRIDCRCGYVVLPQRDVDHETVVAYHNRTGKWPGATAPTAGT